MTLINQANLTKKILSEPVNKWVFNNVNTAIFLVGGFLRDLLLARASMDIDYVIEGNPLRVAKETAKIFNGTLIIFKDQVFRIVLRDGRIIDFTPLRGDIRDDLILRDFTINAIAWSPKTGIIDPTGGLKDLENGVIRVVSAKNISDDPLRILRAYRHAVELSFTIESGTSRLLRFYAPELKKVSSERITNELFKILNNKRCSYYLKKSLKDNVLQEIIRLGKERLTRNLRLLKKYEAFIDKNEKKINRFFKKRGFNNFLKEDINQGLERDGLLKLSFILNNSNRIIGREKPLRLSKTIRKALRNIYRGVELFSGRITNERLYNIFLTSRDCVFEIALILSMKDEKRLEEFLKRADDFIKFRKNPLLNGNEIQGILKCGKGIIIGKARLFLHKSQFLNRVRTKSQAQALILSNFT